MIDLLGSILCVLQNILLAVLWAGVQVVNALVVAIGALVALLASLLPPMPDPPDDGALSATALGWVAYFLPVGGIVAGLFAMFTLYLLFLAVRIALKWVKAL